MSLNKNRFLYKKKIWNYLTTIFQVTLMSDRLTSILCFIYIFFDSEFSLNHKHINIISKGIIARVVPTCCDIGRLCYDYARLEPNAAYSLLEPNTVVKKIFIRFTQYLSKTIYQQNNFKYMNIFLKLFTIIIIVFLLLSNNCNYLLVQKTSELFFFFFLLTLHIPLANWPAHTSVASL